MPFHIIGLLDENQISLSKIVPSNFVLNGENSSMLYRRGDFKIFFSKKKKVQYKTAKTKLIIVSKTSVSS